MSNRQLKRDYRRYTKACAATKPAITPNPLKTFARDHIDGPRWFTAKQDQRKASPRAGHRSAHTMLLARQEETRQRIAGPRPRYVAEGSAN